MPNLQPGPLLIAFALAAAIAVQRSLAAALPQALEPDEVLERLLASIGHT